MKDTITGRRLTELRQKGDYTQERVAKLVNIDRPKLSDIENGKIEADAGTLNRLAELYGVSLNYLMGLENEPGPSSSTPEMRFRAALGEDVNRLDLSGFLTFLRRYKQLAEKYDHKPLTVTLPHFPFTTDTKGFAVEGDAWQLRSVWGLGDVPIGEQIFDLLEDRGISVYRQPLIGSTLSGAYFNDEVLGHVIFVNADEAPSRQVFTAAHELAHLLYDGREGISKKGDTSSEEKLCNRFASAFLMPKMAIEAHLAKRQARRDGLKPDDVISLQRTFGVSYHAMLVRLQALGIIKSKSFEEMAQVRPVSEAIQLGYAIQAWETGYKPEKLSYNERAKWIPRQFVQLVLKAVENGYLSNRKAAEYMNLDEEEWNRVSQPPKEEIEMQNVREEKHYYEVALR
jgi:Zn-dependent peptidase ImmA (M78 family)/transcriptional regulator with XRE-family HTH domain